VINFWKISFLKLVKLYTRIYIYNKRLIKPIGLSNMKDYRGLDSNSK